MVRGLINGQRQRITQFAVDDDFWPMYAKDLRIVEWSEPQVAMSVPPDHDPHLAAYHAERTACIVGRGIAKKKGWTARADDPSGRARATAATGT